MIASSKTKIHKLEIKIKPTLKMLETHHNWVELDRIESRQLFSNSMRDSIVRHSIAYCKNGRGEHKFRTCVMKN